MDTEPGRVGATTLPFFAEVRGGGARSATEREKLASRRSEAEPPEAPYDMWGLTEQRVQTMAETIDSGPQTRDQAGRRSGAGATTKSSPPVRGWAAETNEVE